MTDAPLPKPFELTDDQFFDAFDTCRIRNTDFHHRDHIRLGWIHIRKFGYETGTDRIVAAIRRFSIHNHGDTSRYHETVTLAWMRIIAAAPERESAATFEEWAGLHPDVLTTPLERYYLPATLKSQEARETWVEPDVSPLPGLQRLQTGCSLESCPTSQTA